MYLMIFFFYNSGIRIFFKSSTILYYFQKFTLYKNDFFLKSCICALLGYKLYQTGWAEQGDVDAGIKAKCFVNILHFSAIWYYKCGKTSNPVILGPSAMQNQTLS